MQLDIARASRDRAEEEYNRAYKVYNGYREWQNKRWNLAPGSPYSALPEASRRGTCRWGRRLPERPPTLRRDGAGPTWEL